MQNYYPQARRPIRAPRKSGKSELGLGTVLDAISGLAPPPIQAAYAVGKKLYNKVFGSGDYQIKNNTLVNSNSPVPEFGQNCVRIKHREYLGDVSGSVSFNSIQIPINPGLFVFAPWLSAMASNYEQYNLVGCLFEFVSTSADALNSTNTALGKVVMATEYNVLSNSFNSTVQMLATTFSNYGKPASNLLHAIECDMSQKPTNLFYTRSGPISSGDLRLYDVGTFTFATEGMQAAAVIGGLWVTYDVVFCKPILRNDILEGARANYIYSNLSGSYYSTSAVTTITRDDTGITQTMGASSLIIRFNNLTVGDCYSIVQTASGTALTKPNITAVGCAVTSSSDFCNSTADFPAGDGANNCRAINYSVTAPNATLTFSGGAATSTLTWGLQIIICSL